jgi:hypothetical protein
VTAKVSRPHIDANRPAEFGLDSPEARYEADMKQPAIFAQGEAVFGGIFDRVDFLHNKM